MTGRRIRGGGGFLKDFMAVKEKKELEKKKAILSSLREFFSESDHDKSGCISFEEFCEKRGELT